MYPQVFILGPCSILVEVDGSWGNSSMTNSSWSNSSMTNSSWGNSSMTNGSCWKWSSSIGGYWSSSGHCSDWGSDGVDGSLHNRLGGNSCLGVGPGLVDGPLVGGVGGNRADDRLIPVHILLGQHGLGHVVGGHNWGWLHSLDGSWSVHMGGLGNSNLPGSKLWGDLSESMSFGGRVGEVATQPV